MPDLIADSGKMRFAVNDIFKFGVALDKEYTKMLDDYIVGMLEEEMRVLYVAMTRAEHLLVLATRQNMNKLEYLSGLSDWVSWYKWVINQA